MGTVKDLNIKNRTYYYFVSNLEIETINGGGKMYYEKNYERIGVNTDDDMPLNKQLNFPALTIIIRCVLQNDKELCPQIYLDKCLYKL